MDKPAGAPPPAQLQGKDKAKAKASDGAGDAESSGEEIDEELWKQLVALRRRSENSEEGKPACEHCRLKRTRCDRVSPTCGRCETLGKDCVYSDSLMRRGPPSTQEKRLLAAWGVKRRSLQKRHQSWNKAGTAKTRPKSPSRTVSAPQVPSLATAAAPLLGSPTGAPGASSPSLAAASGLTRAASLSVSLDGDGPYPGEDEAGPSVLRPLPVPVPIPASAPSSASALVNDPWPFGDLDLEPIRYMPPSNVQQPLLAPGPASFPGAVAPAVLPILPPLVSPTDTVPRPLVSPPLDAYPRPHTAGELPYHNPTPLQPPLLGPGASWLSAAPFNPGLHVSAAGSYPAPLPTVLAHQEAALAPRLTSVPAAPAPMVSNATYAALSAPHGFFHTHRHSVPSVSALPHAAAGPPQHLSPPPSEDYPP